MEMLSELKDDVVRRFRVWADECSQLFGGLDIVGIQAIVGKDGREYILEVCLLHSHSFFQP